MVNSANLQTRRSGDVPWVMIAKTGALDDFIVPCWRKQQIGRAKGGLENGVSLPLFSESDFEASGGMLHLKPTTQVQASRQVNRVFSQTD